jgi:DNA polymerase-3 subunit beta
LVDGNFPDYRQLIAKQFLTEATIAKQDIVDRLKITTIFSGKLQQVRLKMYPTEKLFEIESKSDELGETTQNIDGVFSGEDMEMLLNQRFLGDVFSHITSDKVVFYANGQNRPLVIRGVGDHTYTYLIMPMKG